MASAQRSHRFQQFSLRALLLATLAICIALAFLVHRASENRRLIAELEAMGVQVGVYEARWVPEWLKDLIGGDFVGARYWVWIEGGPSDNQLQKLKGLLNLDRVVLDYAHSGIYSQVERDTARIRRELPQVKRIIVAKGDR
jgi:hypothetical protein